MMRSNFIAVIMMIFAVYKNCPEDPLCISCWGAYCISCAYSYPDSLGFCQYHNPIPNCYSYNNKNNCVRCKDGHFYAPALRACVLSTDDPNCVEFEILTGKCASCKEGLLPSKTTGKCNDFISKCKIDYCDVCRTSPLVSYNICDRCVSGYTANFDGNSYHCVKTDNHCRVSIFGVCSICDYGFYYGNNGCVPNPQTHMEFVPNYITDNTNTSTKINSTEIPQSFSEDLPGKVPAYLQNPQTFDSEITVKNQILSEEKQAFNEKTKNSFSSLKNDTFPEIKDYLTAAQKLIDLTKRTLGSIINSLFEQRS